MITSPKAQALALLRRQLLAAAEGYAEGWAEGRLPAPPVVRTKQGGSQVP